MELNDFLERFKGQAIKLSEVRMPPQYKAKQNDIVMLALFEILEKVNEMQARIAPVENLVNVEVTNEGVKKRGNPNFVKKEDK